MQILMVWPLITVVDLNIKLYGLFERASISFPGYVAEQSGTRIEQVMIGQLTGSEFLSNSVSIENSSFGSLNFIIFEVIPFELRVSLQKFDGRHSSFSTKGSVVKHQIVFIDLSGFLQ